MPNNIIAFPDRRMPGRPRQSPMPNTPTAGILAFPSAEPTPEQRLADYDVAFDQLRQSLFDMIRALASIARK
jgi:hypothetical protein